MTFNCPSLAPARLDMAPYLLPHKAARRGGGRLAEEVRHVGCIESSRTLPRTGGGMSPPCGNWLLGRNPKPLFANGRALQLACRRRGAGHSSIRRLALSTAAIDSSRLAYAQP